MSCSEDLVLFRIFFRYRRCLAYFCSSNDRVPTILPACLPPCLPCSPSGTHLIRLSQDRECRSVAGAQRREALLMTAQSRRPAGAAGEAGGQSDRRSRERLRGRLQETPADVRRATHIHRHTHGTPSDGSDQGRLRRASATAVSSILRQQNQGDE